MSRSVQLGVILAVLLAGQLSVRDAGAQVVTEGVFTAQGSVGVTDNVLQVAEPGPDTPADQLPPEWDGLFVVGPGAALLFDTPYSNHVVAYNFGYTAYFVHSEANAQTHTVAYGAAFDLSPTLTLNLGTGATLGQISNFIRTQGPAAEVAQPQEFGEDLTLTVFGNVGLEKQLDELLTGNVGTTVSVVRPFSDQQQGNLVWSNAVGFDRQFEFDILGATLNADYQRFEAITDDDGNETQPAQHELTSRLIGTWQHQLSEFWATTLSVGVVHSMDVERIAGHIVQPYGLGSIGFAYPRGAASLAVEHNVAPQVFQNQTALTDTARLQGAVPLGSTPFNLGAEVSFAQNRVIDPEGNLGEPQEFLGLSSTLGYVPPPYPALTVALSYLLVKQFEGSAVPAAGFEPPQAFTQQTWLLTVGWVYPDDVEGGAEALALSPFRPQPQGNPGILESQTPTDTVIEEDEESGSTSGDDEE